MPCDENFDSQNTIAACIAAAQSPVFGQANVRARPIFAFDIAHFPTPFTTFSNFWAPDGIIFSRPSHWLAIKEFLRRHSIKEKLVVLVAIVFFVVERVLSTGIPGDDRKYTFERLSPPTTTAVIRQYE